ncbi:von Willebrand factor A domain-containing protein 5A-like [Tiliqua scincoides]|uniref:von Willebrand factor A domain-containing protein 5A-like n=1 Tax=Tiliqua scincoides TaxID=71010 RepID=UPI00346254F7
MPECGLITRSQEPVPLRGISVDVVVRGFVADVVSELHYQNEEAAPVETVFVFPLDDEAAVYAFEGLIGGTRIEAQLQEKKKAEQHYEDALAEGHQAFLLQRQTETSDIFSCSLGNLPPGGEATLKLRYVQALAPEADGAIRFVLPAVLNPRYDPRDSEGKGVTQSIPRRSKGQLPYSLSLRATLESPYAINRVESKCTLTPLRYVTQDRTNAQISLAEGHQFDRDVELLIYYEELHRPSALLEPGKAGAASGSLMGDPALLLTLYPSLPASKPALNTTGEFIFLLDCSSSMSDKSGNSPDSPTRIQSAKETLILLLKSLPLGCYFNIYAFGSSYLSFYPQSVEYTQQTVSESLQKVKQLDANMGGTEILLPLKAIYSQPCCEGHPRQLLVFTDGEVENTNDVISEVKSHSSSHRCFSFGIGEGASTALIKGIARAAGGSAEFITGKERLQAKALQSLKRALQPAVTGISLRWDLPSGLEAVLVGSGPQVIFEGQRSLIYAQIHGQHQPSGTTEGTVELQYTFRDQTITESMKFPLQAQESDRLPVHLLAAQTLLQELEGADEEEKRHLALETSLSSGVVCSQTAYVGVNTELGKPLQGALVRRDIPLAYNPIDDIVAIMSTADVRLLTSSLRLDPGNQRAVQMTRDASDAPELVPFNLGDYCIVQMTTDVSDAHRFSADLCHIDESSYHTYKPGRHSFPARLCSAVKSQAHVLKRHLSVTAKKTGACFARGFYQIAPGQVLSEEGNQGAVQRKVDASGAPELVCQSCAEEDFFASHDALSSFLANGTSQPEEQSTPKEEEIPILKLVTLQHADGSWPLDAGLASLLGLSEAEISSKAPAQVVPNAWATVLAILWLHSNAAEQIDEWQLLEAKALRWLHATAGPQLAECVKAGNTLLGSSVSLQAFGL